MDAMNDNNVAETIRAFEQAGFTTGRENIAGMGNVLCVYPPKLNEGQLSEMQEWIRLELKSREIRKQHNVSMQDFYQAYKEMK